MERVGRLGRNLECRHGNGGTGDKGWRGGNIREWDTYA